MKKPTLRELFLENKTDTCRFNHIHLHKAYALTIQWLNSQRKIISAKYNINELIDKLMEET